MSYYDNPPWSPHSRQQSWDQAQAPSRSGASSAVQRDDSAAFGSQYEGCSAGLKLDTIRPEMLYVGHHADADFAIEVARAAENLMKGAKGFGPPGGRRESIPMGGNFARQYPDFEPRMPVPQRPVSEYDGGRAQSSGSLQGYIANQRYGPRQTEAEQMMQAKRRMAAQRERELRNYHQEQQYNRHTTGAKSDRSLSPSAMSEEDRRDLIARQHRALYGNDSSLYVGDGQNPRSISQDARVAAGLLDRHGVQSSSYDSYNTGESNMPQQTSGNKDQSSTGLQEPPRPNSSSPSGNSSNFGMYQNPPQPGRTSNSSPRGTPPLQDSKGAAPSGVAPIGTRPAVNNNAASGQPKRSTPPLNSFGYHNTSTTAERSGSAQSNTNATGAEKNPSLGWGGNSGVWGSGKNSLGVQASVWG